MHTSPLLLVAITGLAAAAATSPSGCGSQIDDIIASCLGTEQSQLNACATNDWSCMCTQITNVLTCYNNCPSDPDRVAAASQQTSWCEAAKQQSALNPTPTSAAASISASSAATSAAGPAETTGSVIGEGAAASVSSSPVASATSTHTGSASAITMSIPGLLTAVVGLVAVL